MYLPDLETGEIEEKNWTHFIFVVIKCLSVVIFNLNYNKILYFAKFVNKINILICYIETTENILVLDVL